MSNLFGRTSGATTQSGEAVKVRVLEEKNERLMRLQGKAILVALNAGQVLAQRLNLSEDVPITPMPADNGKMTRSGWENSSLPATTSLTGVVAETVPTGNGQVG